MKRNYFKAILWTAAAIWALASGLWTLEAGAAGRVLSESVSPAVMTISVEHYKEWNGWTPVLLTTGELTVMLWHDAEGRVFEFWGDKMSLHAPVFTLDEVKHRLLMAGRAHACGAPERSGLRSRYNILAGESVFLRWREGTPGLEVALDDVSFHLRLVRASYVDTVKGRRLGLEGVNVITAPGLAKPDESESGETIGGMDVPAVGDGGRGGE